MAFDLRGLKSGTSEEVSLQLDVADLLPDEDRARILARNELD